MLGYAKCRKRTHKVIYTATRIRDFYAKLSLLPSPVIQQWLIQLSSAIRRPKPNGSRQLRDGCRWRIGCWLLLGRGVMAVWKGWVVRLCGLLNMKGVVGLVRAGDLLGQALITAHVTALGAQRRRAWWRWPLRIVLVVPTANQVPGDKKRKKPKHGNAADHSPNNGSDGSGTGAAVSPSTTGRYFRCCGLSRRRRRRRGPCG